MHITWIKIENVLGKSEKSCGKTSEEALINVVFLHFDIQKSGQKILDFAK